MSVERFNPAPNVLTDPNGNTVDVVTADGLKALVVSPIPSGNVIPTEDAADGTIGSNTPTTAITVGANNPSGKLEPLQVDANSNLIVSGIGYATINSTGQVSVTTGATQIIGSNTSRGGLLITNPASSVVVFIGGSGVTSTTGQELLAGNSISLPDVAAVYGIVATGSQTVSFIEVQ